MFTLTVEDKMSLDTTSNELALPETFDALLHEAARVGASDREAGSVSRAHHEAHLISDERLTAFIQVRAASVLGDIANKVRAAVASSMRWEDDLVVDVMELSAQEYPGRVPRWPSEAPVETLDPNLLSFAGRRVFETLAQSGRKPVLKYSYNGDIRTYSLQIAIPISVSALSGVQPCEVPEHILERRRLVAGQQ